MDSLFGMSSSLRGTRILVDAFFSHQARFVWSKWIARRRYESFYACMSFIGSVWKSGFWETTITVRCVTAPIM